MAGLVKFAKVLTYQLYFHNLYNFYRRDNDLNHIMDIAEFYKLHPELCVSDITSN